MRNIRRVKEGNEHNAGDCITRTVNDCIKRMEGDCIK
jgi:hypothetical protein